MFGVLALVTGLLLMPSRRAEADVTAFLGFSPTPATHATKGFALGLNLLIVGFEIEYAHTSERIEAAAPGLHTGMINGLIQTPTRTQLYLTAGARVTLPDGEVVKARELSGASGLLFRRNSQSGAIEVVPRTGSWGGLNAALHANQ